MIFSLKIDKEILNVFIKSKKNTKILLDMTFNNLNRYSNKVLDLYGYKEIY
jgi:hypothetical protein